MVMWVRAVTGQENDLNLTPQHTNKNPGVAACTCNPSTVEAENGSCLDLQGHADQGELHL